MSDVLAIVIFVGAYVLIATEWVHRVVVALAGAGLMLLFNCARHAPAKSPWDFKHLPGGLFDIDFVAQYLALRHAAAAARPARSASRRDAAPRRRRRPHRPRPTPSGCAPPARCCPTCRACCGSP